MLMKCAVSFILPKASASNLCFVSSVSGAAHNTKSDWLSSSSKLTSFAPRSFAASDSDLLWYRMFDLNPARRLAKAAPMEPRSEEHTSELQSRGHLVCRLLLETNNAETRTCPSG